MPTSFFGNHFRKKIKTIISVHQRLKQTIRQTDRRTTYHCKTAV